MIRLISLRKNANSYTIKVALVFSKSPTGYPSRPFRQVPPSGCILAEQDFVRGHPTPTDILFPLREILPLPALWKDLGESKGAILDRHCDLVELFSYGP